MQWWYVKEGKREGPVEESELKAMAADGRLGKEDLIWNSTMGQDWKAAGAVAGIFASEAAADEEGSEPNTEKSEIAPQIASTDGPRSELTMPSSPDVVSVVTPIEASWDAMKRVLFSPFDLGKWFVFGFSVWLARFLAGREPSFNFRGNIPMQGGWGDSGGSNIMSGAIAGIALVTVAIVIVVSVVLLWVRSRGKFMFLDNAVHNRCEIKTPWANFAQHGRSLFLWTLGYTAVVLVTMLALGGGIYFGVIAQCVAAGDFVRSTIPLIIILSLLLVSFIIISCYISRFLEDFVIPIMYKRDMTAVEAWSCFAGIYRANRGRFLGYGLWCVLLEIGAALVGLLFIVCTCCIAIIPYIGTVILLPIYVMMRFNGLYYLAQYGPDYDIVSGAPCSTMEIDS